MQGSLLVQIAVAYCRFVLELLPSINELLLLRLHRRNAELSAPLLLAVDLLLEVQYCMALFDDECMRLARNFLHEKVDGAVTVCVPRSRRALVMTDSWLPAALFFGRHRYQTLPRTPASLRNRCSRGARPGRGIW